VHGAARRSDIPVDRRAEVRVDSLRIPPDKRLDPEQVYIADVRTARADGSYAVALRTRAWFEARVEALAPKEAPKSAAALADTGVTLYRTAWCGVCRAAASYFRERDVPFVEKDVEQDAAAAAEMQEKAQKAGRTPRGVPVIDFHGNLLFGFDRDTLDVLVRKHKAI
jgi:glutaredoxin